MLHLADVFLPLFSYGDSHNEPHTLQVLHLYVSCSSSTRGVRLFYSGLRGVVLETLWSRTLRMFCLQTTLLFFELSTVWHTPAVLLCSCRALFPPDKVEERSVSGTPLYSIPRPLSLEVFQNNTTGTYSGNQRIGSPVAYIKFWGSFLCTGRTPLFPENPFATLPRTDAFGRRAGAALSHFVLPFSCDRGVEDFGWIRCMSQ